MQNENNEFKPYIPANKIISEFTITSVIIGIILAVVFGAANAYLGLRVGLTVSASIPAAVISMGVIRVILKKNSILENNMVQTIGSAGESLASGAIFTMPALYLWAKEGISNKPSLVTISLIALCGGILGVLFMVPLRNALIVKEHNILPYPEGTACAEVLLAGEKGGSSAKTVFAGMGFSAIIKFIVDGLKIVAGTITIPINAMKTEISTQIYPALIGVGYICGPKISSYMLTGGALGWLVLIPLISVFGGNTILYPGTDPISEMFKTGGPSAIWGSYIRYIGAGAVAAGGIISLIKSLPLIIKTFKDAIKGINSSKSKTNLRTEQDLDIRFVLGGILLMILAIWLIPAIPINFIGAIIIVVLGFFFATVASRMVGLVGSSNNPISGMAIATLLITTIILKSTGKSGAEAMISAICVGSIICIISAMAGDTSQDLKTGFLVGATPKKQQIGELIGTIFSAFAIGGVLLLLDNAWGFGSKEIAAPQATLMKLIVEGVMGGTLPWALIFIGVSIAIIIEILRLPVLPIAIGLYLPLELSTTIMIGGIIKLIVEKKNNSTNKSSEDASKGVLFSSGLIAGEGLIGILLAIFAVLGIDKFINLSGVLNTGIIGGCVLIALIIYILLKTSLSNQKGKNNEQEK